MCKWFDVQVFSSINQSINSHRANRRIRPQKSSPARNYMGPVSTPLVFVISVGRSKTIHTRFDEVWGGIPRFCVQYHSPHREMANQVVMS